MEKMGGKNMFKQLNRVLALLCIMAAVVCASGAEQKAKTHQLKGNTFGYLTLNSLGDISGASYDGTLTGIGKPEVYIQINVANASPSLPYGYLLISKGGNQYLDQIAADLDGTSIDMGDGSVFYFGTATVTAGIGKFAGATGTFVWTATSTDDPVYGLDPTVFTFEGSITY